jgi:hypothetical protein
MNRIDKPKSATELIDEVDELNEEVKSLALNLAIYLAKAKNQNPAAGLDRLEPDFIRLVNGTVKVVQEMAGLLTAARSGLADPNKAGETAIDDALELKLRSISEQCRKIQGRLEASRPDQPDGGSGV